MTQSIADRWFDQEIEAHEVSPFEQWLQRSPQNLAQHWERSCLEAALAEHFSEPRLPTFESRRVALRLLALIATAACVLACLLGRPSPRATADPMVTILDGTLRSQVSSYEPGPNPFYTPPEDWPVETHLEFPQRAIAYWSPGCTLQGEADAAVVLRSEPRKRSLRFTRGKLRVALDDATLSVLTSGLELRPSRNATFTLSTDDLPAPGAGIITLEIQRGELELLGDNHPRTLTAGERVALEAR